MLNAFPSSQEDLVRLIGFLTGCRLVIQSRFGKVVERTGVVEKTVRYPVLKRNWKYRQIEVGVGKAEGAS